MISADNRVAAHLVAVLHLKQLAQLVSESRIGSFTQGFLVDANGRLLTHTNEEMINASQWDAFRQHPLVQRHFLNPEEMTQESFPHLDRFTSSDTHRVYLSSYVRTRLGWGLFMTREKIGIADEVWPAVVSITGISGLMIFLIAGGSVLVTIGIGRRWEKAEHAVWEANQKLEQRVAQRTLQLKDSVERFEALLCSTAEAIYGTDLDGRCTFCNPACVKTLGYESPAGLLGKRLAPLGHEADFTGQADWQISGEVQFPTRQGATIPAEVHSAPLFQEGKQIGHVVSFIDISERRQIEKTVRTLSQAVEQSPVSVVLTDTTGHIEYVNQHFCRLTGYSVKEALGRNSSFLSNGDLKSSHYRELWETISSGRHWHGEFHNRRKDGSAFWELAHIAPVLSPEGEIEHYLAVKEDITLKKAQEAQILHQAHYDALTDLPNRFLCLDRLDRAMLSGTRDNLHTALLYIDLDDFKKVNDTLGHETGDRLLVQAAERLGQLTRDGDTVGRLGGDEFLVILERMRHPQDAELISEKILHAFSRPFRVGDTELVVTTSIGVAVSPGDGRDAKELLRNADIAMYQSKSQGRDAVRFYSPEMNRQVTHRLELEHLMRSAIERNEFSLHYQPVFHLDSTQVVSLEALLRWNNPEKGWIAPDEFIPIAEQTGMINRLGELVLSTGCRDLKTLHDACGCQIRLAINVSAQQFRKQDLLHLVQHQLLLHHLPARCLELEATESLLLSNIPGVGKTLNALREIGVSLSLDDFGTGYASLSYLREYTFDTLKIDRSFMTGLPDNQENAELVRAAIAMARALGLQVISEGVEHPSQLEFLRQEGCDMVQGYLLGKPMPLEELLPFIKRQRCSSSPCS